jgi:hypothetical protein
LHPLELVSAAPWRRVAFTTYALSLSFFEAVILDALVRGGAGNVTIFADPMGVRAGLSEQGARRAGREYEVEPVACMTGAFHPKIGLYLSDSDCHLTVGSGNLTFGGWGMNLECWEHLHPSFAADAFDDVADMLDLLTADDRVRTGAADALVSLAADMRVRTAGTPRLGNVRVLHSVGQSIGDDLASLADGLGGATALTVVSPFFDVGGAALARLCAALGVATVHVHVHPGEFVPGFAGTNWPAHSSVEVRPVRLNAPVIDDPRRMHSKVLEVVCRRGRLLMSGSANATVAGLYNGNIEASVVRIQRDRIVGWSRTSCDPPPPDLRSAEAETGDAGATDGILRAELDGDVLRGTVLLPRMPGAAELLCVSTAGEMHLGKVTVDQRGNFEARAPGVEASIWSGDRLTLRLEQGEKAAEGFVSLSTAAELMRRAGGAAARLLAMLAGTDTPEDVAAILAWFQEDPARLERSSSSTGGAMVPGPERSPTFVPLDVLRGGDIEHPESTAEPPNRVGSGWERALSLVLSAFSQVRGPWPGMGGQSPSGGDDGDDETDEGDDERALRLAREAASLRKAAGALESLLEVMLAPIHEGRHARQAFWIAHYLADRNRPAIVVVQGWLRRALLDLRVIDPEEDAGIAAAALMLFAFEDAGRAPMRARRYFLGRGIDPAALKIDIEAIPGYVAALPGVYPTAVAAEVKDARIAGEQVRSFIAACHGKEGRDGFPLLMASREWSRLAIALNDPVRRDRLRIYDRMPAFCPCGLKLPPAKLEELRGYGVTSCCHLLLCTEGAL